MIPSNVKELSSLIKLLKKERILLYKHGDFALSIPDAALKQPAARKPSHAVSNTDTPIDNTKLTDIFNSHEKYDRHGRVILEDADVAD